MSSFVIEGCKKIEGAVEVQTSKNGVLPVLAATLLNHGVTVIENCPRLSDVEVTVEILKELGCVAVRSGNNLTVDASDVKNSKISCELMHKMRSSVIFLGSLLTRTGTAEICLPGGCDTGVGGRIHCIEEKRGWRRSQTAAKRWSTAGRAGTRTACGTRE